MNDFIIDSYMVAGFIIVISYVPQVISAWKDRCGAKAISLWAYFIWIFTSLASVAYSFVIVQKLPFELVSIGNFIGCILVYAVTLFRRLEHTGDTVFVFFLKNIKKL